MITLNVAGVAHADPLGPHRLHHWLQELRAAHDRAPEFVAVEWDEHLFRQVSAHRDTLRQAAARRWPTATPEFVNALASAVAYEGDTHIPTFLGARTIWLDQGRQTDPSEISQFTDLRMKFYEGIASSISEMSRSQVQAISEAVWSRLEPRPDGPDARDDIFARRLFAQLPGSPPDWAIAILGANHTGDCAGSAIDLLIHNGVDCRVTLLNPEYGSG